mgnify:FL=1|jgi:hypothetical protein
MTAGAATNAMTNVLSFLYHAVASLPFLSSRGPVTFQAGCSASPRSTILGLPPLPPRELKCLHCLPGSGSKVDLRVSYGHLKRC